MLLSENRISQPVFSTRKTATPGKNEAQAKLGDGKLLLANGNTWNYQAQASSNGKDQASPSSPATADAVGLNDNIGINNGFFSSNAVTFTGWVLSRGFVLYEQFNGIPGNSIAGFHVASRLPDVPDISFYKALWESNQDVANDFVGRISGFFVRAAAATHP